MTVCLDTNAVLQLFGRRSPLAPLKDALFDGRVRLALSTAVLLEYEEVVVEYASRERWNSIAEFFDLLELVRGTVVKVSPSFQFGVIAADPDDNKFADCAITANADFVITEDRHFAPLASAGYRPQPITPTEFIRRYLVPA